MHRATSPVAAATLAALCLFCGRRPAETAPPDICGEFRCEGENPRGGTYLASVSIAKQEGTYAVKWTLPHGGHGGVGILEGDMLSVSWLSKEGVGIVVYKVRNDGDTLVGRWAQLDGDGRTFSEVLTRSAEQKKSPRMARGGDLSGRLTAGRPAGRSLPQTERAYRIRPPAALAQRGGGG